VPGSFGIRVQFALLEFCRTPGRRTRPLERR
jgi:hypothetical protein